MLAPIVATLAALQANPYHPCTHTLGEPGPPVTSAGQAAARAEIAAAVESLGGSPTFARYLIYVGARESDLRPGMIHQLDADSRASAAAYRHLRRAHRAAGNPFADRPELWLTFGLFGLNSNYYGRRRDPKADPRELCIAAVAVETYAIAARDVLRRMRRRCVAAPTWADIHRAIQRGDLCPDGRRENLPAAIAAAPVRLADVGA